MKKIISIILAVILVLACGIGIGYLLFGFDKDSKLETYDREISAVFHDVGLGDARFESIDKYPDRWGKALTSNYGMSEEKKNSLLNEPENWLAFTLFIDITNPNDVEILVGDMKIPDNGKNGYYFQSVLDSQQVIHKNVTTQIAVTFFVDDNEPSLEEVTEVVKGLEMYIKYIPMPEDIEAEIPEEDYQIAKVVVE